MGAENAAAHPGAGRRGTAPRGDPEPRRLFSARPSLCATRDATIICPDRGPGALETKCCFDYGVWMRDWDGGKTVPRHHEIQLQTQMFVGNEAGSFEWGVICAWVGAEQFYFERRPIEELWLKLQSDADKFFLSVAAKEEPDPFGAPIEIPFLTALFPTDRGTTLDLQPGLRAHQNE